MNEPFAGNPITDLVEGLHAPLILYARQWLENEAEDIVQEAFLKLLRQKESVDNPAAWLFRVVRNEAISRLRRRSLIGRYAETLRTEQKPWFEARADQSLEIEEVTEKLAAMPMELREVLVSKLWGGLSFQEIGELTETSQSTAHRRYQEALSYLKSQLK